MGFYTNYQIKGMIISNVLLKISQKIKKKDLVRVWELVLLCTLKKKNFIIR